jgi:UPF0755 protein
LVRTLRLGLLMLAALLTLRLWWINETRAVLRGPAEPPATVLVPPGASVDAIGRRLCALGLVRHPWVFRALVWQKGVGSSLQAGEYALEGPLSLDDLVTMMARGQVVRHELTVPEGKCLDDITEIVAARGLDGDAFQRAAREVSRIQDLDPEAKDLEGYLFPDTYDVPQVEDAAQALTVRMVDRFRAVVAPHLAGLSLRRLTLRQLITLASIVELETARADERPRIAAVFLNRIEKGMPLQTDPTVIYAMRKAGRWDGNIRKRDLDIDSPYNTYRHPGLPPGPIASPGRESILAVLHPADSKDLYFVSRNDGSHQFSVTLEEHNRAVERYQKHRTRSGT